MIPRPTTVNDFYQFLTHRRSMFVLFCYMGAPSPVGCYITSSSCGSEFDRTTWLCCKPHKTSDPPACLEGNDNTIKTMFWSHTSMHFFLWKWTLQIYRREIIIFYFTWHGLSVTAQLTKQKHQNSILRVSALFFFLKQKHILSGPNSIAVILTSSQLNLCFCGGSISTSLSDPLTF